ncbi:MAG: hypothetical protein LBT40_11690 [Deltaproteobacteria bacterium]|jgi:hypothetical protein|nr:hypothetical protein [Deltaproteobacteria bacterium]
MGLGTADKLAALLALADTDFTWADTIAPEPLRTRHDVPEINASARETVAREIRKLTDNASGGLSALIPLVGEAGSGRTHLLNGLRELAASSGGFFVAADLSGARSFHRAAAAAAVAALDGKAVLGIQPLARLLDNIMIESGSGPLSPPYPDIQPRLSPYMLKEALEAATDGLSRRHRAMLDAHRDVLEAVFLLGSDNLEVYHEGRARITGDHGPGKPEADRAYPCLGTLVPGSPQRNSAVQASPSPGPSVPASPRQGPSVAGSPSQGPSVPGSTGWNPPGPRSPGSTGTDHAAQASEARGLANLAGLTWLMSLNGGFTVLAIDQLDPLALPLRDGGLPGTVRRAMVERLCVALGKLTSASGSVRTLAVAALLPEVWEILKACGLGGPSRDLPCHPVLLRPEGGPALFERLAALRLGEGCARAGFVPPYPAWPFPRPFFDRLGAGTPRAALQACGEYAESLVLSGRAEEWPGSAAASPRPAPAEPPELALADRVFSEAASCPPELKNRGQAQEFWESAVWAYAECLVLGEGGPGSRAGMRASYISIDRGIFNFVTVRTSVPDMELALTLCALMPTHGHGYVNRVSAALEISGADPAFPERRLCMVRNDPPPRTGLQSRTLFDLLLASGGRMRRPSEKDRATLCGVIAVKKAFPEIWRLWARSRRPTSGMALFRDDLRWLLSGNDEASWSDEDTLAAEPDGDIIGAGGAGRDGVAGGAGMSGGTGRDGVAGGTGRGGIAGGAGRDAMSGGTARDGMSRGAGRDAVAGGADRDAMSGGAARDGMSGGTVRDGMSGGTARDGMSGGAGRDGVDGRANSGGKTGRDSWGGGTDRDILAGRTGRADVPGETDREALTGGTGREGWTEKTGLDSWTEVTGRDGGAGDADWGDGVRRAAPADPAGSPDKGLGTGPVLLPGPGAPPASRAGSPGRQASGEGPSGGPGSVQDVRAHPGRLFVGNLVPRRGTAPGPPVLLPARLLLGNMAVTGPAGSGKTVLLKRIIEEAALQGVPSVAVDCAGELALLARPWGEGAPAGLSGDDFRKAARLAREAEVAVWTPFRTGGRPFRLPRLPDLRPLASDGPGMAEGLMTAAEAAMDLMRIRRKPTKDELAVLRLAFATMARRPDAPDPGALLEELNFIAGAEEDERSQARGFYRAAETLADACEAARRANPGIGEYSPDNVGDLFRSPSGRVRISVMDISCVSPEIQQEFIKAMMRALVMFVSAERPGRVNGLVAVDWGRTPDTPGPASPCTTALRRLAAMAGAHGYGLVQACRRPDSAVLSPAAPCLTRFVARPSPGTAGIPGPVPRPAGPVPGDFPAGQFSLLCDPACDCRFLPEDEWAEPSVPSGKGGAEQSGPTVPGPHSGKLTSARILAPWCLTFHGGTREGTEGEAKSSPSPALAAT